MHFLKARDWLGGQQDAKELRRLGASAPKRCRLIFPRVRGFSGTPRRRTLAGETRGAPPLLA